ncbi:uncharacterized protein LOC129800763 [Phlebotomus papatasi]|uniref:uncharacterized protein LOC129800763 n=1 Tax=Phlebotomus papatasi TaxID=29031 RepID=UPI002483B3AF|nr:uncharacterized protein LOC129800763 [Phlebotomus papatasi]
MENPGNSGQSEVKRTKVRPSRRKSLFSALNEVAKGTWSNDEDYEKLLKAEMSEWNKLACEIAQNKSSLLPRPSISNLSLSDSVSEKLQGFTLDPEAFLAEQKLYIDKAREFLQEHRKAKEEMWMINEVTACALDDVTIRIMEEEKYRSN